MSGVQFSSDSILNAGSKLVSYSVNFNKMKFQSATRLFISWVEFKVSDLNQKEIINFQELQEPHPK